MVEQHFVVTDEWLDHFRPRPGSSWTQAMLSAIDPEIWPSSRRAPVAGWRDRVRGLVITDVQRQAFESKVREAIRGDIAYHVAGLEAAKDRLAVLNAASISEPAPADWMTWPAAPGVM